MVIKQKKEKNMPNIIKQSQIAPLTAEGILAECYSAKTKSTHIIHKYLNQKFHEITTNSPKHKNLDTKFICSIKNLETLYPQIDQILVINDNFDFKEFLTGIMGYSTSSLEKHSQAALSKLMAFVDKNIKHISISQSLTKENAYKHLIGVLDAYDDASAINKKESTPKSTYLLRSALLLCSQRDGINLSSWMVYTKSGKPSTTETDSSRLWAFLDNWHNWVPEAQAAMAKFSESAIVKAKSLANAYGESRVVLLRGGFGAGKTTLTRELFKLNYDGVIAPDAGKKVVRQSMPKITHAAAHVQGSQIAYKLFDAMINQVPGTVVYDTSLSYPSDVQEYLAKGLAAGKKLVVYDVARNDMARCLQVLKRSVDGDDPRIPPAFIIKAAIADKIYRKNCMDVIAKFDATNIASSLIPEYHFLSSDSHGADRQEVAIIKPQEIKINKTLQERLQLEGLTFNESKNRIESTYTADQLRAQYQEKFQSPVKELLTEISPEEQAILHPIFAKRIIPLASSQIVDLPSFYEALPSHIKNALPTQAINAAFASIAPQNTQGFLASLAKRTSISYLDLPLGAALTIHQSLQNDPWSTPQSSP
jgi:hypothetical protein